jgi:sugar phosphate isomerase/epimerase
MKDNPTCYGGSTFPFMWSEPARSALLKMQRLGLNDFDVILVPGHLWHDELSAGQRSALAAQLREDGLRIESLNLPALDQNLASCIPEARAYAVALYTRTLELAAELGARGVVVVPGRVSALFPPPRADSEGWLADGLAQLLKVAERLDLKLYVESHPQTPIPTVDKIERFFSQLVHDRLKIAYDVSNAEFVSEDQAAAIRRLAPRLGQVHLSDGTRARWRHDRVGLGTVNFAAIQQALEEVRFSGIHVLEIVSATPLQDMEASITALNVIRFL